MVQYVSQYDSYHPSAQNRYVPTKRIGVSVGVYLPDSEIDMSSGTMLVQNRRSRSQAKRLESERLAREQQRLQAAYEAEQAKGGVRITMRTGAMAMAVLLVVFGIILLYQKGRIASFEKSIAQLEQAIGVCREQNTDLNSRIAEASDPSRICYAASQRLNMIPADSVEAIQLVAVDTRPRSASDTNASAMQTSPVLSATNH